ncbi:MAG: sialate O-acetylesterase [Rariglobus sp.]|nr:sialate O-acetylesterase [Rariglobus sp.]
MNLPRLLRLILLNSAFVIAHSAFGADAPLHLYLLMGQSNMAGRGALDATPPADNPRILVLAPDGSWVPACDPLHEKVGRTEPGVGPGLSFAQAMLKADPKVTIGLIPCAVGGSPLKRWVKGGDLYSQAVARAKASSARGTLEGVLWHQGETDSDKQPWTETYESRLVRMIADLRSDLGRPDLPVVVGQLGEFLTPEKHPGVETIRAALKRIPTLVPHTGYVDSTGLVHKGDELHFDTASARKLGTRYAEAMMKLQKP